MTLRVLKDNPSYVYDDVLGLVIPTSAAAARSHVLPHPFSKSNRQNVMNQKGVVRHIEGLGTILEHDDHTGIAYWPAYASGWDDMLMRAMVQGYMANAGQTPVLTTLLPTIVTKIQSMVGTWSSTVRGKKSPVKKTLDLMARAQDSQFGSAEFVRLYMGALLVDNRGAIGAQVPIETIDFDAWDQYGMEAEVIPGQGKKPDKYILRMEQAAFRENQGLWMVDGLSCYPTGNSEYPYWIAKHSRNMSRNVWVLIHRDFGFQIAQPAGPKNNQYPGFGQSGTWRFSPYAVKHMAIDRQDWEHLIFQPMRGIIWVSGLDTPTQFHEQLEAFQKEREEQELMFYPGVLFGGSKGEGSKITMIPWSEPPAGYTAEGWRNEWIDNLAAAFHLNVTHLVVRLGEGAMTQSDVASSIEAETAVAAFKQQVEMVWNYLAPPRVIVTVIWQTDRLKRYQTETFRELSLGISRVQQKPQLMTGPSGDQTFSSDEEQTFTRDEIRGLFEEYIGIEIPEFDDDESVESDKKTGDEVAEIYRQRFDGRSLASLSKEFSADDIYVVGRAVMLLGVGQGATIIGWNGKTDWVWVRTDTGHTMLIDGDRLCFVKRFSTRPTIREFKPKGKPLKPATEVDIDPDAALEAARDTWTAIAPDELDDLL